jgi:ribosome-associated protein
VTESQDLAVTAARAAAEKQASDVSVLDVRELIGITDYFVIASGATDRQVKAITEEVEASLRGRGTKPTRREGAKEGRWVLLDYVDFVIHVFHEEDREYYALERLWADAPVVEWNARAASSG